MSEFKFKYFTIQQSQSAMKVGTDSMVFGATIYVSDKKRMLDVGAGTGILSLMLAQRNEQLKITAIEIDDLAADEAQINFEGAPFDSMFELIKGDFLQFNPTELFDLIVTNPPYFQGDLKGKSDQRNIARHTDSLPFGTLIDKVMQLLTNDGHFWIILPVPEMELFTQLALEKGLFVNEEHSIYGKPSILVRKIVVFSKKEITKIQQLSLTLRDSSNAYTEAYKQLTIDYHGVSL